MGKPIKKVWFGVPTTPGAQIVVNGVRFADNTTATNVYILKQTGSTAYVVQDTALTHAPEIVFMVNANSVGALLPGQCFILATPFGGSPLPCEKIAQYRVSLYDVPNTVPRETGAPVGDSVSNYSWSTIPAAAVGQADLITGSGAIGAVLSIALGTAGFGYFTAPAVSFTGGGVGASATATVANGAVTGFVLGTQGSGYANGGMTLGAPTASVAATATTTVAAGAVSGYVLGLAGGYYAAVPGANVATPPASVTATATGTVTVDGGGAITALPAVVLGGGYYVVAPIVTVNTTTGGGADITANIANGVVTGFNIVTPGTLYAGTDTITIAAPPAAVQATVTPVIAGGVVTGFTPGNVGAGYFTAPLVTINPPPAAVQATASATISV